MRKPSSQKHRYISLLLVVAVAITLAGFFLKSHALHGKIAEMASIKMDGFILPTPKTLTPFQLTDSNNKPFTQQSLLGHWSMMFFGFSNCQYVCPTTLSELNKFYNQIKTHLPTTEIPQILFVTVDPARDTLSKMHEYVTSFNKDFLGVRGDDLALKTLATQLNISYKKVPMGDNDYSMQHSAEIMLFNPQGQLFAYFSYPQEAEQLVPEYQKIMQVFGHG